MSRGLLISLILLAAAGAAGGAFWLHRSAEAARAHLETQQASWTQSLNAGVPLGADKAAVQRWLDDNISAEQRDGLPLYNDETHSFLATAEEVDAGGLHFPCSAWEITLDIKLGADETVIRREVGTVGRCRIGGSTPLR